MPVYIIHKNIWEVKYSQIFLFLFLKIIIVSAVINMSLIICTADIFYLLGHSHAVSDRLIQDKPNLRRIPQIDLLRQKVSDIAFCAPQSLNGILLRILIAEYTDPCFAGLQIRCDLNRHHRGHGIDPWIFDLTPYDLRQNTMNLPVHASIFNAVLSHIDPSCVLWHASHFIHHSIFILALLSWHFHHDICLHDVKLLHAVKALKHKTTLKTGLHFLDIVLKSLE